MAAEDFGRYAALAGATQNAATMAARKQYHRRDFSVRADAAELQRRPVIWATEEPTAQRRMLTAMMALGNIARAPMSWGRNAIAGHATGIAATAPTLLGDL